KLNPLYAQGHKYIPGIGIRIPDGAFKNIGFLMESPAFYGVKVRGRGKIFKGIKVRIKLIIQAALKLSALPRKLCRIKRKLLVACCRGAYGAEIGEPGRTA